MKVIIIGGVAAGMSAASKIRRSDENAIITVYEKGVETSYGACGLPYYISGANDDVDLLRIRKPQEFRDKQNIDVKLLHEVVSVNTELKQVEVSNLVTGEKFTDNYDKLVISSGASPIIPPIEGLEPNLNNVFTVKTIEDGQAIKSYLLNNSIHNVVIAGAGYIGLEMVEACHDLKKQVTLIELQDKLLASVDDEIGSLIKQELYENNINVRLKEKIVKVNTNLGKVVSVETPSGVYEADALILATGVRPNTKFLEGTDIELDRGAIVINDKMETSVKDIYAGGDCAVVYHKILKSNKYIPLGTYANKQGKLIGENVMGANKSFPGGIGTAAIKILNLEVGRTGISEEEAKAYNMNYGTVFVKAPAHAPYYPGNEPIAIKLIYEKEKKTILGAQLAGKKGAALRADMFAIIIDAGYTAEDIQHLDLLYAPPYAYVWDAIQIAAGRIK
ncbi:CoA-disulfide reductase [Anaerocolumna sp.]|uniref:CoA-disulfide reductase n=1 Tax=Anaerocolumna sp. TaxID=2041569 RepID=UPI0028ABA51B|nr:CoA-disulfide reductase [Anaerocolumna sp.]